MVGKVQEQLGAPDGAEAEGAEARFAALVERFSPDPAVALGTGFGTTPGLRVGGRIFAMLVGGALVVKLPRERVDGIVAGGGGTRFAPGTGRVMKEWVTVPPESGPDWGALAAEALAFVGAAPPPSGPKRR